MDFGIGVGFCMWGLGNTFRAERHWEIRKMDTMQLQTEGVDEE